MPHSSASRPRSSLPELSQPALLQSVSPQSARSLPRLASDTHSPLATCPPGQSTPPPQKISSTCSCRSPPCWPIWYGYRPPLAPAVQHLIRISSCRTVRWHGQENNKQF